MGSVLVQLPRLVCGASVAHWADFPGTAAVEPGGAWLPGSLGACCLSTRLFRGFQQPSWVCQEPAELRGKWILFLLEPWDLQQHEWEQNSSLDS